MTAAPIQAPEELRRPGAPPRRRRRNPLLALLRPLAVSLLLVAMPAGVVAWVLASPLEVEALLAMNSGMSRGGSVGRRTPVSTRLALKAIVLPGMKSVCEEGE